MSRTNFRAVAVVVALVAAMIPATIALAAQHYQQWYEGQAPLYPNKVETPGHPKLVQTVAQKQRDQNGATYACTNWRDYSGGDQGAFHCTNDQTTAYHNLCGCKQRYAQEASYNAAPYQFAQRYWND